MKRHEFLRGVHTACQPRSYLEIGINDGRSLALSRTRSIGVDPAFKITSELHCDLQLVKATSDDFFAGPEPVRHFQDGVVDLAFIDGLHILEFALRDFINIERQCGWTSVVVFDDMLPRSVDEAARDRHTTAWTGDVFKIAQVLDRYRPDLTCIALDTEPTGMLLVLGADPTSTALPDRYDDIIAEFVRDDPQEVPKEVLRRSAAADPQRVLDGGFWPELIAARDGGIPRDAGYPALVEAVAAVRPDREGQRRRSGGAAHPGRFWRLGARR